MAAESGPAINPIEQFSLRPILSITVGGHDVSLTNSAVFMLVAVAIVCGLMAIAGRGGATVPTRMQAMAEIAYEFIAGMVRSAICILRCSRERMPEALSLTGSAKLM